MSRHRLQIRGDPAIRHFLFRQLRVNSEFDTRLDVVLYERVTCSGSGVSFHAGIHLASGQVTLQPVI